MTSLSSQVAVRSKLFKSTFIGREGDVRIDGNVS
jgi:hypothetical protein